MPTQLLSPIEEDKDSDVDGVVTIEDSEILDSLRVDADEERLSQMKDLRMILTNVDATIEEKNNAYEQLKLLEVIKGKEEKLESKILENFRLNSFVKIDDNQIKVVISNDTHNVELANKIMRSIQEEFDEKMYISVKFQV
jgi:stage III sporulation protein AH